MLKIIPIGSGSTGNCMYAEMGGHRFLIDLGVSWKACRSALALNEVLPSDLEALFVTHTHTDHIVGLSVGRKYLDIPYFASAATRTQLSVTAGQDLIYNRRTEVLDGLWVTAFPTSHDCPGSAGFLFESDDLRFGFATDLGEMDASILELLSGSDVIVIECNHDIDLLKNGPYPASLKKRILSPHGHLSNADCAAACRYFSEHGTGHFLLAHLSRENNTPRHAYNAVSAALDETDSDIRVLPVKGTEAILF